MKISRETLREIMSRRPSPKSMNWQAIQTLKKRIAEVEAENAELKKRIAILDGMISDLNSCLSDMEDDEEELVALLRRYRTETPPGHQPHMIMQKVDELLGLKPPPQQE